MSKNRIIIITGPKHSGKTSAGGALAEILKIRFQDLDKITETQTGKTPRELFRENPEIFKKAEKEALLLALSSGEYDILATGGGIIDNQNAMELITKNPEIILVYLEISAETAWKRILNVSGENELPAFLDKDNPKESHSEIHARRAMRYRAAAHLVIDAEGKEPLRIAMEIITELGL